MIYVLQPLLSARVFALMCALMFVSAPAPAVIETYEFSDPGLEQRYQQLSAELRCPKCQNQNIADSNAPIAQDLRRLLHQQLEVGASDEEILDYMVARYGEFVRYRPSFGGVNSLLWLAPVLLLLAGLGVVVMTLRSRKPSNETSSSSLSDQERAGVEALLADEEARL